MDNKKWYNDKRFKYGTYSTVISVVVIALLIAINLIVGLFDYKFDMTKDKLFSLGPATEEVLEGVSSDVNIYTTFKTNADDNIITRVNEVLTQYKQQCRYISVENTDLYLHPDFAQKFKGSNDTIDVNSIIVEGNGRHKIINYDDYYKTSGEFSIEASLTSAIQFVSMEAQPLVCYVTGHNEVDVSYFTSLTEQLELSNYEIKSINLLSEEIPQDCTVLMMATGKVDYSEEEADKVKSYLANDGRAFVLLDGYNVDVSEFKNMKSIITAYGVDVESKPVYEGDESAYMKNPAYITPQIQDCDITKNTLAAGYRVFTYPNLALTKTELSKQGLEISQVLTTTEKAFVKADGNNSYNYENGDTKGPFDLAVTVCDNTYTDKEHSTKLFITGCGYSLIDPNVDEVVNYANSNFVTDAVNWLNDEESPVSISAKSLTNGTIVVDTSTQNKIKIMSWAVIPGILFVLGFAEWLRRKNK
jgi:hypothetical protein